jgi:hypothetical protein
MYLSEVNFGRLMSIFQDLCQARKIIYICCINNNLSGFLAVFRGLEFIRGGLFSVRHVHFNSTKAHFQQIGIQ